MVNKRVVAIMAIALSTIHRMQSRIASKRRRKIWVKSHHGGLIKSTEKVSNELDILESHEHVNSSIVLRR